MNETLKIPSSRQNNVTGLCRTRLTGSLPFPYLPPAVFKLDSCQKCLAYLKIRNSTEAASVRLDPSDDKQLDEFCEKGGVTKTICSRWKDCCTSAIACCEDQLKNNYLLDEKYCPQTWDAFSCIPQTSAGTLAKVTCPDFLFNANLAAMTSKNCTGSARWFVGDRGREVTDYEFCKLEEEQWDYQLMLVKAACELISVITLCISIFIFQYCRKELNKNSRVPGKYLIHTYTFLAMLLYFASLLLGEAIFYFLPGFFLPETFSISCVAMSMLTRFFMNFSYSAMSVDAFFLHWNMAFVFGPTLRPWVPMLAGFAVPLLVNGAYIALRFTVDVGQLDSDNCWINPFQPYEWIIYALNIFCLALNFGLLINLIRLIVKTSKDSNRATIQRRAKRALGDMILFTVIFGTPQFFIIFSHPYQGLMYKIYLIISNSAQMLQGAIASIALCFSRIEVHEAWAGTTLGKFCSRFTKCLGRRQRSKRHQKFESSTHEELLLETRRS